MCDPDQARLKEFRRRDQYMEAAEKDLKDKWERQDENVPVWCLSITSLMTSKDEHTVVNDKLQSTLYTWSDSKNNGVSTEQ